MWNPEFLREGWAVQDTIDPDRLVVGRRPPGDAGERAADVLREVYHPAVAKDTPFIVTDYATAELVKVAANAFLATKISFINAMAEIAEVTGADVTQLADAIGHDARIGRRFLGAGIGFGGGCLPKDIRAFSARAEELGRGESVAFLREVDAINLRRRDRAVELVVDALGGIGVQEERHRARRGLQAAQRRHPRLPRARRRRAAARSRRVGHRHRPRRDRERPAHPPAARPTSKTATRRCATPTPSSSSPSGTSTAANSHPEHAAIARHGPRRRRRPQLPGCRRLARSRLDYYGMGRP